MAGVQRHFLADARLQGPANELRHQHLVFQRADLQADPLVQYAIQHAGDLRYHVAASGEAWVLWDSWDLWTIRPFTPVACT